MSPVKLQVQPVYAQSDVWSAFAAREGLVYELIEPSFPSRLEDTAWLERAASCYAAEGRVVSLHGAFVDVNPASGDGELRRISRLRVQESCENAVRFGAKNVVFHASAHPFLSGAYLDNWAAVSAEYYAETAQAYGLRLFLENSMDAYPEALVHLMTRAEGFDLAVCLDLGHAHYSPTPMAEWFESLGPHIQYLHLSDNLGRFDDHLPAGRGSIDWAEADALWRACSGAKLITVEQNSLADVAESLDYLRTHHYFGQE